MQEERQEAMRRDSTRQLTIDTEAAKAGFYDMPKPVPEPTSCKYCGKQLLYQGLLSPFGKRVILWKSTPERCTCEQAVAFWERYDAREKARREHEELERQRQEEMRRYEELIKCSGMKGRFQNRRFDNFARDTDGRARAYVAAKRYADSFDRMLPQRDERGKVEPPVIERNGLFIAGSYGTGKTHLAAAIANQLLRANRPVICMTMIDLLDRIRETYQERMQYGEDEAAILDKYQNVPLLIIDDIGSEQPTEWGISKIFAIINARYEAYMPTVITTNYSGEELERRMTPEGGDDHNAKKTLDRLKETCVGIDMTWESWRTK